MRIFISVAFLFSLEQCNWNCELLMRMYHSLFLHQTAVLMSNIIIFLMGKSPNFKMPIAHGLRLGYYATGTLT